MFTVLLILIALGIYDAYSKEVNSKAIIATVVTSITAPILFGRFLYNHFSK